MTRQVLFLSLSGSESSKATAVMLIHSSRRAARILFMVAYPLLLRNIRNAVSNILFRHNLSFPRYKDNVNTTGTSETVEHEVVACSRVFSEDLTIEIIKTYDVRRIASQQYPVGRDGYRSALRDCISMSRHPFSLLKHSFPRPEDMSSRSIDSLTDPVFEAFRCRIVLDSFKPEQVEWSNHHEFGYPSAARTNAGTIQSGSFIMWLLLRHP